jgi:hypothetical protein
MSERDQLEEGANDLPMEREPGLNRRRLLTAGAGGFVLAATGMFVPERLVEAASQPVQRVRHHAGQRHHKRRHQRQHRRDQRRRDNGSSRGGGAGDPHIRWISYVVYNDRPVTTPNQSVSIVSWARDTSINDGPWHAGASFRLFNGVNATFSRQVSNAAIEIDGRYLVDAENFIVFAPLVSIDYGGTMTRLGYEGGTEAQSSRLSENEQIEADIDGHHFRVKRIADTEDYKVFEVHLT